MKVAYIAGPFRADTQWAQERNIRKAEAVALQAWRAGFAVICPHANTRFFQGSAPDSTWLRGDLEILERCDCVITTEGWRESAGAKAEVRYALDRKIPVYATVLEAFVALTLGISPGLRRELDLYGKIREI